MSKEYDYFTLNNGLKVILIPLLNNVVNDLKCLKNNNFINNIGINLFFSVGSRNETKNTSGIVHFLEHGQFKIPYDNKNTIMRHLQKNGSVFNAETSIEFTHYYTISDKKFLEDDIKIMSKILFDLNLEEKAVQMEKRVILEEYFMSKDNVKKLLIQNIFSLLVDKNHPITKPVIGDLNNIKKTTANDLINFKKEFYHPNYATLVLSGNFNNKEALNFIDKYFNINVPKNYRKLIYPQPITLKADGMKIKVVYKHQLNQIYLAIAFKTIHFYDKNKYIYDVLTQILKTKLFTILRDNNGISYNSTVSSSYCSDFGLFGIFTSIVSLYIYQGIYIIIQILNHMKKDLISSDELISAKNYLNNSATLELASILNHNSIYGMQALYNVPLDKLETPKEYLKKINSVSINDINNISKKLFNKNNLLFSSVGNLKNDDKLKKILNLL
jgi:predicted Zn-dependent peptidase